MGALNLTLFWVSAIEAYLVIAYWILTSPENDFDRRSPSESAPAESPDHPSERGTI